MTKALSTDALVEMLKRHDQSLVKDLLKQVDTAAAIEKRGNNVAVRKAAFRKALEERNAVALTELSDALEALIPLGEELAAQADQVEANGLTDAQALVAMTAYLKGKLVAEGQSALQDLVRNMVFTSMDKAAAEQGEEFPEHTAMILDVPELGKRFTREGVGRKEASFDYDKLRAVLGDEVFFAITAEQVTVTRTIDESALAVAVVANPELMEQLREAVIPGDWKPARLMVRDIPANEKE